MSVRLPCVVPFCKRTMPPEVMAILNGEPIHATECVCAKHWPLLRAERRRVWLRAKRAWRNNPGDRRLTRRFGRLWSRLTRDAIEVAAGIGA